MKFFLGEKNLGNDATREQVDKVIEMLKEKAWNVEYGLKANQAEPDDVGKEEEIQDAFADDFIVCLDLID
ncbi:conserved hypothetical protein [Candidatus Magnetomoraceae bacterium gMMP-15]